jgi:protein-L-isoaspartate O-methyltransferase
MPYEDQLDQIRARLSVGSVTDTAFDQLLSAGARWKSSQHWSPFCVGRRAGLRFAERDARRILDVGSGPGKFCIAAASARPELEVHGIEQRAGLAASAITLASRLGLQNLQLRAGDALLAPWRTFDGFYEAAWYHVDRADDVSRTTRARVEGKLLAPLFSTPGAPAA